jgi:hypothetical protein
VCGAAEGGAGDAALSLRGSGRVNSGGGRCGGLVRCYAASGEAAQAVRSRGAFSALHSGSMAILVHLVQSHQRGHAAAQGFVPPAVDRRPTPKGTAPERSVHRGPHGASQKTPRAGRRATGGLRSVWAALVCSGVAPPRRREALGPAGPAGRGQKPPPVTGTPASRAPSIFRRCEGSEGLKAHPAPSKQYGRRRMFGVIPGRHEVASPESITTAAEYGLRAPRGACARTARSADPSARPRNDKGESSVRITTTRPPSSVCSSRWKSLARTAR